MFSEISELFFSILVSYMGALEFLFVVRHIYHWSFQHNGNLLTLNDSGIDGQNDNESLKKLQEHLRTSIVAANEKEFFGLKAMKDGVLYNDGFRVEIDKETALALAQEKIYKVDQSDKLKSEHKDGEADKNDDMENNLRDHEKKIEKQIACDNVEVAKSPESLEEVFEEPCVKKQIRPLFESVENEEILQLPGSYDDAHVDVDLDVDVNMNMDVDVDVNVDVDKDVDVDVDKGVDVDVDVDVDINIDIDDEPMIMTQTVKTQLSQSYSDKYSYPTSPKVDTAKSEEESASLQALSSSQMSSSLSMQSSSSIDTTPTIPEMQFDEYERQAPDGEDIASPQYSDDYLRNLDGIKHRPLVRDDGTGRRRAFKKRRSSGSSTSSRDSRQSREEELKMFTSLEEEECERIRKERSPLQSSSDPNLKVTKSNRRHRRSPAKDSASESNRSSLERLKEEDTNPWGELKPEQYKNTEFWKREKTLSIEEEIEDTQKAVDDLLSSPSATKVLKTSSFEEATPSQHEVAISTLVRQQSKEKEPIDDSLKTDNRSMPKKPVEEEVNVSTDELGKSVANTSIASTNDFSSALPIDQPNPQDTGVVVACNQNEDHTDSSHSTGGLRRSPRVDEIDHYEERWEIEKHQRSTTTSPAIQIQNEEQILPTMTLTQSDLENIIDEKSLLSLKTGSPISIQSGAEQIENAVVGGPIIEVDFAPEDSKFHMGIEEDDDEYDYENDDYSEEILRATLFKDNLSDYSELSVVKDLRRSRSMSPSIGRTGNDLTSSYLRKSTSPTRVDPNTLGAYSSKSRSHSFERGLSPTIQIVSPSDSSRSVSPPISTTSVSDSKSRSLSQEIPLSPTIEIQYVGSDDNPGDDMIIEENIDESDIEEENQPGRLLEGISDFYDFNASINPKRSLRSHTPSLRKIPPTSSSRSPTHSPIPQSISSSPQKSIESSPMPSTSSFNLNPGSSNRSRSNSPIEKLSSEPPLSVSPSTVSSSNILHGLSDFYDFNVRLNESAGETSDELQLSKTPNNSKAFALESKNGQPCLQENKGGTKKTENIKLLMATPTTPNYDRSFSEEWSEIEEIKKILLAGSFVRSTYVGESMDLSDKFEDLRQQTRDFQRSKSKSRSPIASTQTPMNRQQNEKKQLQEKILDEITKTTLNFQEFSNNLTPNYLDYDRRSSDSALIQKPEILIQFQDTTSTRQFLNEDDMTMLECLEGEEYHHFRRFSLYQDYQTEENYPSEDYDEYISHIEVRTKDGTQTWTRSDMFEPSNEEAHTEKYLNKNTLQNSITDQNKNENESKKAKNDNERELDESTVDLEVNNENDNSVKEINIIRDYYGDDEEFEEDSNSDDERQTVVEVDDGIDEEIWDFTDRPEESTHEQSECEEAEREMDRYANHDINDWKENGASGGICLADHDNQNEDDNNDDDVQIDQIYDDAIRDRKQSGILRDYDSLLNDIQTDTDKRNIEPTDVLLDEILQCDDDQYSILSPRSVRNSRGSSRESSRSFLENERGENEHRYLGDAWESAIQSTRLRSRYKIAPAAPFVNYDELDDVNTNYVPKKEYKWRKNFRLDEDDEISDKISNHRENNQKNDAEIGNGKINIPKDEECNGSIESQYEDSRRYVEERKFSLGGESITLFSRSPERSTNSRFGIPEENEEDLSNRDYENKFVNCQASGISEDPTQYLAMDSNASKKLRKSKRKSKRDLQNNFDGLEYLSVSRRESIVNEPVEDQTKIFEDQTQIEVKKKSKRKYRRGSNGEKVYDNENASDFNLSRKSSLVEGFYDEHNANGNENYNQSYISETVEKKKSKKKRKSKEQIDIVVVDNENVGKDSQQLTEIQDLLEPIEQIKTEKMSKKKSSKHSKALSNSSSYENSFNQQSSFNNIINIDPHSSNTFIGAPQANNSESIIKERALSPVPVTTLSSVSTSNASAYSSSNEVESNNKTNSSTESSESYYLIKDASLYPLI